MDFRIQEWIPEEEGGEDAPEVSLCRDAGWRNHGGRYAFGNKSAFYIKGLLH